MMLSGRLLEQLARGGRIDGATAAIDHHLAERDFLEMVLRFWQNEPNAAHELSGAPCPVQACRRRGLAGRAILSVSLNPLEDPGELDQNP
jgi:hypothetical protein